MYNFPVLRAPRSVSSLCVNKLVLASGVVTRIEELLDPDSLEPALISDCDINEEVGAIAVT